MTHKKSYKYYFIGISVKYYFIGISVVALGLITGSGAAFSQTFTNSRNVTCEQIENVYRLAVRENLETFSLVRLHERYCNTDPRNRENWPLQNSLEGNSVECGEINTVRNFYLSESEPDLLSQLDSISSFMCHIFDEDSNTPEYYPNGQLTRSSGGNWYYSNGQQARSSSGTWYYPNGQLTRSSSGTWYYPNGKLARSSSGTWYYPNGQLARSSG